MLYELHIKNFAIITDISLRFGSELVIFTGETGAGKSIIIDAVEAILGGRVDATMIRTGAEEAIIEGEFQIPEPMQPIIHAVLEKDDLLDEPGYVTLSREIRRQGRNIARVNGRSVNVSILRDLGELLVDVHGQSEHLSLLRVREHLSLLDRFTESITEPLAAYQKTYHLLLETRKSLRKLREQDKNTARRADLLTYQINEIEAARLQPGEDENLTQERNRLANVETLASLAQETLFLLDEGDPENRAITDLFGQVVKALGALARLDSTQADLADRASETFEVLIDLSRELSNYTEGLEFNPKRLEEIELRLALIRDLKRKYGQTIEAILDYGVKSQIELDEITNAEEKIAKLEKEEEKLLKTLSSQGQILSSERKKASRKLSQAIERELTHLRMDGAEFGVEFQTRPDPNGVPLPGGETVAFDANGFETVQFLVAPNPGEGLKPLVKIASGGETSRLMLALKNVLARADHTPTLIFDEIDQGIGGRIGTVVGEKLWQLARQHQVLCITHLPQLAVFGEQHYRVAKIIDGGRTSTRLDKLENDQRVEELAQMLGSISDGTLQSARELMEKVANLTKKQISQR